MAFPICANLVGSSTCPEISDRIPIIRSKESGNGNEPIGFRWNKGFDILGKRARRMAVLIEALTKE